MMSSPLSKRDCIVSQALNDAKRALSEALERESLSGNHALTKAPPPLPLEDSSSTDPSDPDDLAAAFFAKQAKPPSLPVDTWARLILLREKKTEPTNDTAARKQD
jgi:hypothetical protein